MKLLAQPPDTHQFVGLLLSAFGIALGVAAYYGGIHVLETQYSGGILENERYTFGLVGAGIAMGFLVIGYAYAKE